MGALAGILNYTKAAGQVLPGNAGSPLATSSEATGGTNGSTGKSSSSSSSATISANDFLTLLVTEMQNQDPTATTDPNEYINQLVQVNSLEQLIDINQNLATALGNSTKSSGSSSGTPTKQAAAAVSAAASASDRAGGSSAGAVPANTAEKGSAAALKAASAVGAAAAPAAQRTGIRHIQGSLSIPDGNPAAQRVARGLDGRKPAASHRGGLPLMR